MKKDDLISETVWAYVQTKKEIDKLDKVLCEFKTAIIEFSEQTGQSRLSGKNNSEVEVQEVATISYDPTSTQKVLKDLKLGKHFMDIITVKSGELVKLVGAEFAKSIKSSTKTYQKVLIKKGKK